MRIELYKKMNDDEKLQFIKNLEDCKETLLDVAYIQNEKIDLLQKLANTNEYYAGREERKVRANEKYHEYCWKLLEKYDLLPTPTSEITPAYVVDGGSLSDK